MSSTSESVRACIEEDVFLQDALERQIVNTRELARWLQEHKGVEGSIDTIASAIRRVAAGFRVTSLDDAWSAFAQTKLRVRDGVCALHLERRPAFADQLPALLEAVEHGRGGYFRLMLGDRRTTVLVDEEAVDEVLDGLGEDLVERLDRGLAEVGMAWPAGAPNGAGALGIALTALSIRELPVYQVHGGEPETLLLIDRGDRNRVFDMLQRMVEAGQEPPSRE